MDENHLPTPKKPKLNKPSSHYKTSSSPLLPPPPQVNNPPHHQAMSSSSSSAMGGSHGALAVAAATAMAFSGTLVLLSLCRGKLCLYEADPSPCTPLRSCLSSRGSRGKSRGKGAKRVRFAADVVDNEAAGRAAAAAQRMPANREALYRGMLRDRSMQRAMCSY